MTFIEKWKSGESALGQWLAETATGSLVKVGLAPLILWIGTEADTWNLPGWAYVAIVAVVPVAVNMLNPADKRMGLGKDESA